MAHWRLLSQSTSDSYKIYFSSPSHNISHEIIKGLQKISFNFISTHSPNSADIIIFLVLNSQHLTQLPNLPIKTILIIKSTLLRHLPPHRLPNFSIVEFETYSQPAQIAGLVLSKFIHNYSFIPNPKPPPTRSSKPKLIFQIVLVLFIVPWLSLLVQIPLIFSSLSCLRASLVNLNLSRFSSCTRVSQILSHAYPLSVRLSLGSSSLLTRIGYPPTLVAQFLSDLSQSSLNFAQLAVSAGSSSPSSSQIANLNSLLSQQSESLAALLADARSLYQSSSNQSQILVDLAKDINNLRDLILKSQRLTADLPRLLSLDSLTTYLILVQDSFELRPSGGFIDHIILATVDHGRLTSVQFLPSSSLDRNPPARPSPPADFIRLLNQSNWYFRDSNWDPDFSISSRYVTQLAQKSILRPPDVIVAVNSQVLGDLLSSQPDFAGAYLTILHKNTTPPTYLMNYSQDLFNKIKSSSPAQYSRLVLALIPLLDSRQIFINPSSFTLPSLTQLGWSGLLQLPTCRSTSPCLTDFLYPTFTNIGSNKSDAYTHFQSSLNLTLTPTRLISNFILDLNNSAQSSSWPEGVNKNYLRLFLPPQVTVDRIQINHKNFTDYTLTQVKNLTQLSLVVSTNPNSSSQIDIQYHMPLRNQSGVAGAIHYQLDLLRQPGIPPTPITVKINYPADWFVTAQYPPSVARPGYLQYNTSIIGVARLDLDISLP